MLLVASCYSNGDKLRPDWPLTSYADLTFFHPCSPSSSFYLQEVMADFMATLREITLSTAILPESQMKQKV